MSLTELIELLKAKYSQTSIETKIFDFEKVQEVKSAEPKYLFRGENKIYDKTNTTLYRLFEKQVFNQHELFEFYSTHFHLYLFLREALWDISVIEKKNHNKPSIELAIAGFLQHYGFDTSFIDLTSNIKIAANFAAMNKVGSQGSILVIESNSLNAEEVNYYFDLTKCQGERPKKQESYVIWDQFGNLDLKDNYFLTKHNGKWFNFSLTGEDKLYFLDESLLSTEDDEIVFQINEWWRYSDIKSIMKSSKLVDFINNKIKILNKKSG